MQNLFNIETTKEFTSDLALRVYTSNLLGQNDDLVLHGGGNTSVKSAVNGQDILFVKGSGWDLVSIKEEGFAPVDLNTLKEMAKLEVLSDSDMVAWQKAAMINKDAPNPSVEAILHAIIPYKFVDHTHADAVVTISNSENGEKLIKEVFANFLIVPYVMPGFVLAKEIFALTQNLDWNTIDGIILHNHGIFTFDDDAKKSYDKMIDAVTKAEEFLAKNCNKNLQNIEAKSFDIDALKTLVSKEKGFDVFVNVNQTPLAINYASKDNLKTFATRGMLTPEHIIRTKRAPLVLENKDIAAALEAYIKEYRTYFASFANGQIMLNPAPNYAVIKDFGVISFGKTQKEADIINDIINHTMDAVLNADMLGGYKSLSLKDSFDMEYWELEQAKLKK